MFEFAAASRQIAPERADTDRRIAQLENEIGVLCGNIAAAEARLVTLIAEFEELDGWAVDGIKTHAQWLMWRCGMAPHAARDHIRIAQRLSGLELIRAAFATGELSYYQVRTLCRSPRRTRRRYCSRSPARRLPHSSCGS